MSPGGISDERFEPGRGGAALAYEHVHRYALAARVTAGRRTLDVGCGSGYGPALLRRAGALVTGLDLDRGAARRAAPAVCASALALPWRAGSWPAVVCFELLEHADAPEKVIAEVARVLTADGIALFSTPDRGRYAQQRGRPNPFHRRELERDELLALLSRHFAEVELHAQSVWAGSWVARLSEAGGAKPAPRSVLPLVLEARERPAAPPAPWTRAGDDALPAPLYWIALCAREPAALESGRQKMGAHSVLHDPAQSLLGEQRRALEDLADRDATLDRFARHARDLEGEREGRDARIAELEAQTAALETARQALEARARDQAEENARALAQRDALVREWRTHARQLEAEWSGTRAHASNLEEHRDALLRHVEGLLARTRELETELAEARRGWPRLRRALRGIRRRLGGAP